MYTNKSYTSVTRQYTPLDKRGRNRVHLKIDERKMTSGLMAAIDRAADEKLKGGYNTAKKNLCETCWTFKSTNGSCNCID